MKEEYRILSATAILGYGFPISSFEEGLKRRPHVIAADAGSTDPGPYYLGEGVSFTDRDAVKRDLELMITAGVEHGIPVVVGTAGGAGGEPHLVWCQEIIEEIAKDKGLHFRFAVIHAEVPKDRVLAALSAGQVHPLEPAPALTEENINAATRIVGQMGMEPFIKALDEGAQVILAGRAYDPAVFAASAVREGCDRGLAVHLGKILECGAICALPGSGSDCIFGYLGEDYFKLEPLSQNRACTTTSTAAHTLYEKTNPYILPGPGGHLDLHNTTFEQITDQIVKVTGTRFIPSPSYTVKLEGAKCIGYRTVAIAGTRDPVMIEKIDEIIQGVKERVADNFKDKHYEYALNIILYGKNGVMGVYEPVKETKSHELGIVIEAVAPTQEIADTICSTARSTMLHFGYEGRRATAGNLAFPYSPSDFHAGRVYEFCVYHVMDVTDPTELFPMDLYNL